MLQLKPIFRYSPEIVSPERYIIVKNSVRPVASYLSFEFEGPEKLDTKSVFTIP